MKGGFEGISGFLFWGICTERVGFIRDRDFWNYFRVSGGFISDLEFFFDVLGFQGLIGF
jgi:hypothetical protein